MCSVRQRPMPSAPSSRAAAASAGVSAFARTRMRRISSAHPVTVRRPSSVVAAGGTSSASPRITRPSSSSTDTVTTSPSCTS